MNYYCKECGKEFSNQQKLSIHIKFNHQNPKEYYDKWLKKENEGICKNCGSETEFKTVGLGYKDCCSSKCAELYKLHLRTKTNIEKYGVENSFQREDIKEKNRKIFLEKYGVENPSQSEKIKKKKEKTVLKHFGVKYPTQSKKIREKTKKTNLEKYGVEYTHQNREILDKSLKTRRQLKQFRDTNLTYQGSYELDFLEKFYDKIDIENGPSIPYLFEGQNKVYHSDFYIPSKNLIVEIKSSYILKLDEEINEKKQECLKRGYNYILILDKNYKQLKI